MSTTPSVAPSLTEEEREAIAALHRLARKWPKSLLLFGGSCGLSVRKIADDGSYGASREVDHVPGIRADGGDGGDY